MILDKRRGDEEDRQEKQILSQFFQKKTHTHIHKHIHTNTHTHTHHPHTHTHTHAHTHSHSLTHIFFSRCLSQHLHQIVPNILQISQRQHGTPRQFTSQLRQHKMDLQSYGISDRKKPGTHVKQFCILLYFFSIFMFAFCIDHFFLFFPFSPFFSSNCLD